MKQKARRQTNLKFMKDSTDGFRGYILHEDHIKLDVLGINNDGSLEAFAFKPIPELRIEPNKVYCFSADLKTFTPY